MRSWKPQTPRDDRMSVGDQAMLEASMWRYDAAGTPRCKYGCTGYVPANGPRRIIHEWDCAYWVIEGKRDVPF